MERGWSLNAARKVSLPVCALVVTGPSGGNARSLSHLTSLSNLR